MWSTPLPLSDKAQEYLGKIIKLPREGADRYTFFQNYLEDADEMLLSFEYGRALLDRFVPRVKPYEVVHTNLYKVHQRVAATFHDRRVLLIGDAAHVNNPLGGMGMNFGIHDAEKLDHGDQELSDHLHDKRRAILKLASQRGRDVSAIQVQGIHRNLILPARPRGAFRARANFDPGIPARSST